MFVMQTLDMGLRADTKFTVKVGDRHVHQENFRLAREGNMLRLAAGYSFGRRWSKSSSLTCQNAISTAFCRTST